jgi:hypothetical protein
MKWCARSPQKPAPSPSLPLFLSLLLPCPSIPCSPTSCPHRQTSPPRAPPPLSPPPSHISPQLHCPLPAATRTLHVHAVTTHPLVAMVKSAHPTSYFLLPTDLVLIRNIQVVLTCREYFRYSLHLLISFFIIFSLLHFFHFWLINKCWDSKQKTKEIVYTH